LSSATLSGVGTLVIANKAAAASVLTEVVAAKTKTGPLVVVIDDSMVNLTVYERIVRQLDDVEVTAFQSSTTALAWLLRNTPDLVVIDYMMPEVDGLEIVRRIKMVPTYETIPIVMITASKDKDVRRCAVELGVDDFLEKPADPVAFLARCRNLLKLRQHTQRMQAHTNELEEAVAKATADIRAREREVILHLIRATEFRDSETKNHVVRMGHYAKLLARSTGMSATFQDLILLAAPMHDIGKVAIPDRILLKNGKLTESEWSTMKTHAEIGYEILKDSKAPLVQLGAEIALTHHEKWDGSGYPKGLAGADIPIAGRICAITDVFDALLSNRPYKPAWRLPEVIDHLRRSRGTHFDPVLVDAFLDVMVDVQAIRREFADGVSA